MPSMVRELPTQTKGRKKPRSQSGPMKMPNLIPTNTWTLPIQATEEGQDIERVWD